MNYKNYNLLLKAIIEYIKAIKNKGISEKDIRIFKQINDIIYILISKEYNTPELYKELEQISYGLREKYNKKLSQRIYVDFFDNLYEGEIGLKQEMDIGIVKKELDIKDIREKLEKIEYKKLFQKIVRNGVCSYQKESEESYNIASLIIGMHKASIESNKNEITISTRKVLIESELYSYNKLNNSDIELTKPIYRHCLYDNERHQFQPH